MRWWHFSEVIGYFGFWWCFITKVWSVNLAQTFLTQSLPGLPIFYFSFASLFSWKKQINSKWGMKMRITIIITLPLSSQAVWKIPRYQMIAINSPSQSLHSQTQSQSFHTKSYVTSHKMSQFHTWNNFNLTCSLWIKTSQELRNCPI